MTDYFVEERSGVIEFGPLAYRSDVYPRRTKTNWHSLNAWIHLLICLLAVPLIIWNLYLLLDLILDANNIQTQIYYENQQTQSPQTGTVVAEKIPSNHKPYHWFGFLIAFCAIFTYLFAGVFALIVESASLSEKLAKFLFVIVYLSIAISVFVTIVAYSLISLVWIILLFILLVLYGFGFARFLLVSSIHLNEEGPRWYKPLLYACLALIPILSTIRQCKSTRHSFGCLPNDYWFGGRHLYVDLYSFVIMVLITIISAIPLILAKKRYNQT